MKILLSLLLIYSTQIQAQIFRLNVDSSSIPPALLSTFNQLIQDTENDINQDIPANSPRRLMKGMADSSAMAGKGQSNDYITHFDAFVVGAGLGIGADLTENKDLDSDLSGAGVQAGALLGLNTSLFLPEKFLGLDTERLNLMMNFFTLNFDRTADDSTVEASLLSIGAILSYKVIEGKGNRLLGWDGVRIHTGYQYNSTKFGFTTKINEVLANEDIGGGSSVSGTITGSPNAEVDVATSSIPIELSTAFNFLYFISFYTGIGLDLNYGQAKGAGTINGNTSTLTCTGGACGGGVNASITPEADINYTGKVQTTFTRGFVGFQFSVPYVRIFVHANHAFGTELYSASTGLRLAF
jgi:hypothetical protein